MLPCLLSRDAYPHENALSSSDWEDTSSAPTSSVIPIPNRLLSQLLNPRAASSFLTLSSLVIFCICVPSNFSPPACRIFRSSIALIFFSKPLTFFSFGLPPGVNGLVTSTSGGSDIGTGGGVEVVLIGWGCVLDFCDGVLAAGPFGIPFW